MEPLVSITDAIKGFVKSTEGFVKCAFLRKSSDSSRQTPIEKMKRLPLDAFSELMKLTDRQDRVERMLSFRLNKGLSSQESYTQIKGIINVVGFLLFGKNDLQHSCDALHRARIKTGIQPKLRFETVIGQKDALFAEFVTSHEYPLALESLMYSTPIKDFSSVSVALGAQCSNFAVSPSLKQEHCPNGFSPSGPPLFSQHHSCAAGVMLKGSKIAVSLAELVSGIGMQHDVTSERSSLNTFLQISYQPYEVVKVNLSGLWQTPTNGFIKLGTLALPLNSFKQPASSTTVMPEPADNALANSGGSVAFMLDSEVDESAKLGVWLQAQKSNPSSLKWGVSLFDVPYDTVGWGLKASGMIKGQLDLQMEGFLKLNLGRNFVLQPGFVYLMDGRARTPAIMFQSSWCL